jgi:nickel-dependent lactate racemase
MKIDVAFGRGKLEVDVPDANLSAIYRKKKMEKKSDPERAVREALAVPIGSPTLFKIARGKTSACIVVNDITRPVPNSLILPPMIEELTAAGIPKSKIILLNATGTHRPNVGAEAVELLGEKIASEFDLLNHDCFDADSHRNIGVTASGTEVNIDARYLDCDVKILTGLIEPHFMAGYSGGRKAVCPGIASIETVRRIHSPFFMEMPNATNCVTAENPLHIELTKIARMAGVDFILNVALDEERNLCGVFCGDLEAAHRAGVEFAIKHDMAIAKERADIVVTSSAGYPLDKTFYQTIKGMVGALNVVKERGTIIIASECGEGLGNDTFSACLDKYGEIGEIGAYIEHISKPENFTPDQWQAEKYMAALRKADIVLVSRGLTDEDIARARVRPAPTLQAALDAALKKYGRAASVAVIPEGPYVVPCLCG